jgi:hypothetical protein
MKREIQNVFIMKKVPFFIRSMWKIYSPDHTIILGGTMNYKSFRTVFLVLSFLIGISVSFAQSDINQDKRTKIFNDIYSSIKTKFCKNSEHIIVKVYIDDFTCSNCNGEKEFALNRFLKDYLIEKFQYTGNCVKLVSQEDPERDFTIRGAIFDRSYLNHDYPITVSISVKGSSRNVVFFGERYNFTADNFNQKEYDRYKNRHTKTGSTKADKSMIVIRAVSHGDSYKEEDKYFLRTIYGFGWIEEQVFKKDTGVSGYYPANQKIEINGKKFVLNSKKEFFHGNLNPGVYEITAKFNETYWDAYNRQQNIRKERNKRFKIAVDANDNLEVNIYFIYDGKISDIQVQAFRKKEVEIGRQIQEIKEVIEVYY